MTNLIKSILVIASENPFGFTINLDLQFLTDGFVVAYKETQNCFGIDGLKKVVEFSMINECAIGGWLDEETNLYYFDSCMILFDEELALEFAKQNEQIAFFDLTNLKEIRV